MTGRCMYCNHCQPCPARIDIAAVTKFLDLATQQAMAPIPSCSTTGPWKTLQMTV